MPSYAIASFRSRQQVFGFESALKRAGLRAEVVSTPREVALGCGLSVRFASEDWPRVSRDIPAASGRATSLAFIRWKPGRAHGPG